MTKNIALVFLLFQVFFSTSAQNQQTCSGSLPSRLVVGGQAIVTPGDANNIRQNPSRSASKIGRIPAGGRFEVLEGPICADGYTWWKVNYTGIVGWTAESGGGAYWLEMVVYLTSVPTSIAITATAVPDARLSASTSVTQPINLDAVMPIFVEDFSDNRHNWSQLYEDGLYYQVENGVYVLNAFQGAQQVADTHFIREFGLDSLTVYALTVDFVSLSEDPTQHCPALVINYNHVTFDASRLRRIEFCNQAIVSMHDLQRTVDNTVQGEIDATDGRVHRFGVISDGQTLSAVIDGQVVTSIPYDQPLETVALSVIDYSYNPNEMFQEIEVMWDNLTIAVPITCPYTVSLQVDSLEIVNSVESDPDFTMTFVGGDEVLIGYGISAVQAGRSATDYGFSDAYYVSWGGNMYQGSRALDFPMLRRVVSCEQDAVAYIALQESDVLFAKNLGVLQIPFSPDMPSPQTVTEQVSGLTLDSTYDYQVTYTISVAQGVQSAVDKTQAQTDQVYVDNSQAVMVAPVGSGAASDEGGTDYDTYYSSANPCVLTYDRGLAIKLFEYDAESNRDGYFVACGFIAQAGDTIMVESAYGYTLVTQDLVFLELSDDNRYTLEQSGFYTVFVNLLYDVTYEQLPDEPIVERQCDASGYCRDTVIGVEPGGQREVDSGVYGYIKVSRIP
jgi:hypothetical protein